MEGTETDEEGDRKLRVGDAIFVGPIGPIPLVREDDPRRAASRAASLIAQAAIECEDLIALVVTHPDPLVRMQAVPRLKARFPDNDLARAALIKALTDADGGVRCEAISAVASLALPSAGDLLATALSDADPDARFVAAIGLQALGDKRAPDDAEAFAYPRK